MATLNHRRNLEQVEGRKENKEGQEGQMPLQCFFYLRIVSLLAAELKRGK